MADKNTTSFNFPIETNTIPAFWQKRKGHHFSKGVIRRVQDLTKSSSWADETTYLNLANAPRGTASKLLFSMADMETKNTP